MIATQDQGSLTFGEDYSKCNICRTSAGSIGPFLA